MMVDVRFVDTKLNYLTARLTARFHAGLYLEMIPDNIL